MALSTVTVLSEAERILLDGGYTVMSEYENPAVSKSNFRLAEDEYGVVLVAVYEAWEELLASWEEAQGALVDIISEKLARSDPKAWEGFLVFFCPSRLRPEERREADHIRYNTARVRKIVAAGDELRVLRDVERALLPLLPLQDETNVGPRPDVFSVLPSLLANHGIDEALTRRVLEAYDRQESLVESINSVEREE